MRFLEESEADDPILSVVNLIDVFLVVIAALLVAIAQNPMNPFTHDDVTIITNPGKPNMEIVSRQGEKIVRYQASGQVGSGDGIKAGVAYRMKDGSMVYVPETQGATQAQTQPEAPKP
ncbi:MULTISPECIES: DUF2149 domain-containing protein [unclassified Cupriavidus]|uniref:DUF2149 domain-containing protein n=1 Tax=unclassified Cupriavidus TaxID=2640874 RepID=UPI00088208D5|nr:DUF2149 domain-containing protein [Cupriavidus sp. YR651]SDD12864.1 hypothetical protein SAMN05216345_106115 [Cupriavidus sp. YR651]